MKTLTKLIGLFEFAANHIIGRLTFRNIRTRKNTRLHADQSKGAPAPPMNIWPPQSAATRDQSRQRAPTIGWTPTHIRLSRYITPTRLLSYTQPRPDNKQQQIQGAHRYTAVSCTMEDLWIIHYMRTMSHSYMFFIFTQFWISNISFPGELKLLKNRLFPQITNN